MGGSSKQYKICVVGLGSIGKRHIRNVSKALKARGMEPVIDVLRSGKGTTPEADLADLIRTVAYSMDDLEEQYDAAFITNPTVLHYETLRQFAGRTEAFFIEKPVFHTSDLDPAKLGLDEGTICYVACPLRYTSVIRKVKEEIDFAKVLSVRAESSSYLPDWRPGTDYRKTYSASKALGGGVSIDLIHEWDYLTYLMGMPEEVHAVIAKVSDLEIDSDDIAVYIGRYEDKVVEVHLDYFTREPQRQLTIKTNEKTYVFDLIEHRDTFQMAEIEHFLDIAEGKAANDSTMEDAIKVLKIAEGKWI